MLSLICLRSLFRDGYLLQVDIVFGPRPGPVLPGLGAPVSAMQAAAVDLLGGEATGKIYAVGALFLAGFAPMILFRRAPWYAQCAAGVLGALNPWVYGRMVEGQWGVVVAAAGLFLWLAAWEALRAARALTYAALLAVCSAAIVAFDPHAVGPVAVLTVVAFVWQRVWRERDRLRWTALSQAMLALLLSYGVVLFFLGGQSGSYENVRQFTRADFAFFRSVASDDYGLLVNLVGLYGYWGERIGRFPLATGSHAWWPLTTAVIVGAAVLGAWLKRDRAWLLLCGVIGLLLSASTALPGGVDAAVWLSSRVPLVSAYREPQKWSALWLLAVVTLAAGAVEAIAASPPGGRRRSPGTLAMALAYALAIAALLPAGSSQIRSLPTIVKPLRYPDYWYATDAFLERTVPGDERVAVLPWHLYQPLRVTEGRLAANPARVFFPGLLTVPRNIEIPGRATEITSRYDRIGLAVGREASSPCALARTLRRLGIRWALVLDGAESAETMSGLHACDYSLVEGRPGFTGVLRDARTLPE
ncbi:MAG: hypothetical protein ACRDOF_02270 [Gaiellaceae bacterium]